MLNLLLIEDNPKLSRALEEGLEATGEVLVVQNCTSGEEALEYCLKALSEANDQAENCATMPNVALMDVQLAGAMNGIQAIIAIRREIPRFPVVFYSIQDEEAYYRDFRRSGILSHYAYVRKSNYLLPKMIVPLLKDAIIGRSFIDPEIEARVQEVRQKDEHSPMALLEPNEQLVARMLAQGLTNEQIATRQGFRDKRTISRINGQIYLTWGLNETAADEKIARTRATIILHTGRVIVWAQDGTARIMNENGDWFPFEIPIRY
jgi:DNA-binding NarL/FixJ family response regulator